MGDWQAAKDAVDAKLRTLSDHVRKSSIPEVAQVAGEVETLLAPLRVKLPAALMTYDRTPMLRKARDAAMNALA